MDPRTAAPKAPAPAPATDAPAAAQFAFKKEPSEDVLLSSLLGNQPKKEQVRPDARAQDDRRGGSVLPEQTSPSGENEESGDDVDESSIIEAGTSDAPADDQSDTDAEAGDDAGADEQDEDDADPLDDDLFADHDRDEDGEGDEFDATKLGDNAKLSVTVDGEEREVTLGELKRRYAGEGAIEKRLQEATEARKSAVEDYQKGQTLVLSVLQTLGQALFRRTVQAPSEELRRSNPTEYLLRKDQYDAESRALAQQQQQIQQTIADAEAAHQERTQAMRQEAAVKLRRMMPILADPEKGPKVRAALIDAAREIGYTDEDIAACSDPLMFKTVALAARELRRMKKMKVEKVTEKPRSIAAKGSQNRSGHVDMRLKQNKILSQARADPTDENLLATMLAPAPKKKRR